MDQVWWVVAVQLGVAGSMATVGSLNVQWWAQDRSERVLGFTGLLCWSVALALIIGAAGLAFPSEVVWQVIVPVRAVVTGMIVVLFLATLSSSVPLPGYRAAMMISIAAPVLFAAVGSTTNLAYEFAGRSPWPHFQPIGNLLIGVSTVVFAIYSVEAARLLPGARRWQLAAAASASLLLVGTAVAWGPSLPAEALTSVWTMPIAGLLAWWCSARVLTLQGSLMTAEAARQRAEYTVHFQARHDQLTGLPNRIAAAETLQDMIERAGAPERIMVASVQIKGLDQVVAAAGSASADLAVKNVANYLASALPPGAALARFNESTFLFMTRRPVGRSTVRLQAETYSAVSAIRRAARMPPELSIVTGIAITTESCTAAEVLQQSGIALAAAEMAGVPMQLYRPELREGIVGRARTVRLLNAAVDRDEFELHYQPVLDAVSGMRVSVEALVRWRHHGRLHPPGEWIPVAEHQGLMPAIGLRVLEIAVRDHALLRCPIAVNVSPRQFTEPEFATKVLATLGDCPPSALILEVTESSVMTDPRGANAALETLRAHGIRIALDDFGTQYSSLSRLAMMPFDIVKIDRSFVSRVQTADGRAMVTAIHALARALGKSTVAEGVETSEQLQVVQDIGCDLIQGFLTGRPVPLAELLHPPAAVVTALNGPTLNGSALNGPALNGVDGGTSVAISVRDPGGSYSDESLTHTPLATLSYVECA